MLLKNYTPIVIFIAALIIIGAVFIIGTVSAHSSGPEPSLICVARDSYDTDLNTKSGAPNPAALYCEAMGYDYKLLEDADGDEYGVCVFPDGQECEEWAFYRGECGLEFSYCAQNGLEVSPTSHMYGFSGNCTTCVMPDGLNKTVFELTGLETEYTSGNTSLNESLSYPSIDLSETLSAGSQTSSIPAIFDWSNYNGSNWMTSVKNQGSCGSCWAFGAVGVTEALYNIYYGIPDLDLDLSEQYLVSTCCTAGDCSGGWHNQALSYIRSAGITDEACFPYQAKNSGCDRCADWSSRLYKIDITGSVSDTVETIKEYIVGKGPLAVGMHIAYGDFDENGIWRHTSTAGQWHVVVICGYNTSSTNTSQQYWIAKNSWGTGWSGPDSEEGYFKLGIDEPFYIYYADIIPNSTTRPTQISLFPHDQEIGFNETSSVDIVVGRSPGISEIQLDINFDPAEQQIISVTEGGLFSQSGCATSFNPGVIDNNNGTISGIGNQITVSGCSSNQSGVFATIHFQAKPKCGPISYEIVVLNISDKDGSPILYHVENAFDYSKIYKIVNLSTTSSYGGGVTSPGQSGPFSYRCGTVVNITATPYECYHFVNWSGPGVDAGRVADPSLPSTTITMDDSYSIQANFVLNVFAPWYDSFAYRQPFTVNGSPDGALLNYQIKLILHRGAGISNGNDVYLNNHCNSDFSDVRFTTVDNTNPLDYWIESYNASTDTAVVWVELEFLLPASPEKADLYIYYGNSTALSYSNGTNTFPFFDNFDNGMVDPSLWTITGNPTETGTLITIPTGAAIRSKTTFGPNYSFRALANIKLTGNSMGMSSTDDSNLAELKTDAGYTEYLTMTTKDGSSAYLISNTNKSDAYHIFDVIRNGMTNVIYRVDGKTVSAVSNSNYIPIASMSASFKSWGSTASLTADWIFIRACTLNEPSFGSWEAEETPTLTTASSAGGNVTTPGEPGPYTYSIGQVIDIIATPDPCYHFVNWTGSGVDAGKVADPNSGSTTITMDGNYLIKANFVISTFQLTTVPSYHLEIQVNDSNDDAYGSDRGVSYGYSSSSQFLVVASDAASHNRYNSGFVFDNVTVPHGATITAATLEMISYTFAYPDANCKIYGNDVDNANNFTDEPDVSSRTCTTAYTSWVDWVGASWITSPDIKSVVQEITDRAYWVSGNSMCIILKGNSDINKMFEIVAYDYPDYGAPTAAKLNITYFVGSDGGSVTTPGQPGPYTYNCGTNVELIATPDYGYRFVNWIGSGVDAGKVADPYSATTYIIMDGNYSVQANFAIDSYTLTTSSSTGGSMTSSAWQEIGRYQLKDLLMDVYVVSPTDVYAAGMATYSSVGGPILHYDGDQWSQVYHGSKNIYGVWASSSSDVYAVGEQGTILHTTSGDWWDVIYSGTTDTLNDIWGSSSSDIFAVGQNGAILHYDGSAWTSMISGTNYELVGIWGTSSDDVFATGTGGVILHYDGNSWEPMNSGTENYLYGIWGSSSTDVFTVGTGGTILHYDGNSWMPMNSSSTDIIWEVWGASPTSVFAVTGWNEDARILHYDGNVWNTAYTNPATMLCGVSGVSDDNIFVVGVVAGDTPGSFILQFNENGAGTSSYECGTEVSLTAIPDYGYLFVNWTGSGVDAGKVADPYSATTYIIMDGNYSVQANFEVDNGPFTYNVSLFVLKDIEEICSNEDPATCFYNITLTDEDMNNLRDYANRWAANMTTWSDGYFTVNLSIIEIEQVDYLTADALWDGYWLGPWNVKDVIYDKIPMYTDFIIVTQSAQDFPIAAWGLTYGANSDFVGMGGRGYSWCPWDHSKMQAQFAHEIMHQIQSALILVGFENSLEGEDVTHDMCGDTSIDSYSFFSSVDWASKDPCFEACENYYDNWSGYCDSVQPADCEVIYHQFMMEKHFPRNIELITCHCCDGIQNYGETSIDKGGPDCPKATTLSITANPTQGGNVSASYDCCSSIVVINANANTGYQFVNWTGSGVDAGKVADPNSPSTTILMDADYSVQANFAIIPTGFYGDANRDGKISGIDYSTLQLMLFGVLPFNAGGDADMNGRLQGMDYSTLQLILFGVINATPKYEAPYDFLYDAGFTKWAKSKPISSPPPALDQTFETDTGWVNASEVQYSNISNADGIVWNIPGTSGNYAALQCKFTVLETPGNITSAAITLCGSAETEGDILQFWAWNFNTGSWTQVGGDVAVTTENATYTAWTSWGKVFEGYIDSDGYMYVLVNLDTPDSDLNIDYIQLTVAYP